MNASIHSLRQATDTTATGKSMLAWGLYITRVYGTRALNLEKWGSLFPLTILNITIDTSPVTSHHPQSMDPSLPKNDITSVRAADSERN